MNWIEKLMRENHTEGTVLVEFPFYDGPHYEQAYDWSEKQGLSYVWSGGSSAIGRMWFIFKDRSDAIIFKLACPGRPSTGESQW